MSQILSEVLRANRKYSASFGEKGKSVLHPLVPKSIPIYGFVYDVHSGKLIEVEGAQAIGKAA